MDGMVGYLWQVLQTLERRGYSVYTHADSVDVHLLASLELLVRRNWVDWYTVDEGNAEVYEITPQGRLVLEQYNAMELSAGSNQL